MNLTIPATNIGDDTYAGCAVVTLLSPEARAKIRKLQTKLNEEFGSSLWMMPQTSLHSTLCEIIQPKKYAADTLALYRDNYEQYQAALLKVLSKYGPINVTFNDVAASQHAIVIYGDDGGVFNQIRAELVQTLPFPTETKQPPDAVHSSIARYTKELDLSKVQSAIQKQSILFEEVVSEFQFMYPIQPHLLEFDIVQRYSLSS